MSAVDSARAVAITGAWALALAIVGGCGSDKPSQPGFSSSPPPPSQRAAQQAADAGAPPVKVSGMEYGENDFVESDRNRDPFRSFADSFVEQGKRPAAVNQRAVLLPQFSVDELKLVAIVTGGDYPRAMLVDPKGIGWVVKRGDYLGRPEIVHTGGSNGTDYQLNWRVDRVRDGDLVLLRDDPAQPGVPPASRVIPIRPADAEQKL